MTSSNAANISRRYQSGRVKSIINSVAKARTNSISGAYTIDCNDTDSDPGNDCGVSHLDN